MSEKRKLSKWLNSPVLFGFTAMLFFILFCEQLINKTGVSWRVAAILFLAISLNNIKDVFKNE